MGQHLSTLLVHIPYRVAVLVLTSVFCFLDISKCKSHHGPIMVFRLVSRPTNLANFGEWFPDSRTPVLSQLSPLFVFLLLCSAFKTKGNSGHVSDAHRHLFRVSCGCRSFLWWTVALRSQRLTATGQFPGSMWSPPEGLHSWGNKRREECGFNLILIMQSILIHVEFRV